MSAAGADGFVGWLLAAIDGVMDAERVGPDAAGSVRAELAKFAGAGSVQVMRACRNGGRVVRAVYGGRPGHPVLLSRRCWDDVATLEGDVGARALVEAHPEWVVDVEVGGVAPPDVDTPRDYHRLLESPRPKHDPPTPRSGW